MVDLVRVDRDVPTRPDGVLEGKHELACVSSDWAVGYGDDECRSVGGSSCVEGDG